MSDSGAGMLVLVPLLWVVGALVIYQALSRRRAGAELWALYRRLGRSLHLDVRVEVSAGYGLPDLVGRVRGRSVAVHPIVGRGSAGIPKTAYAVAHRIAFQRKTTVIPHSVPRLHVSRLRHSVHIPGMSSFYDVTTDSKENRAMLHRTLDAKVARQIDMLFGTDRRDALALFLGPGTAIFYTEGWETDRRRLVDCLERIVGFADVLDERNPELPAVASSPFFERLERSRNPRLAGAVGAGLLAALGVGVIALAAWAGVDASLLLAYGNMGAVLLLMGATRIYAAYAMQTTHAVAEPAENAGET